jgi:dihydrofolate reductase
VRRAQSTQNRVAERNSRSVRAMLAGGLVDELHLLVYPLTRGKGPRLFAEGAEPLTMELTSSAAFNHGVVYLKHRPAK